ncbi:hypothetical protein BDN67DRAFT_1015720 [Paxillus ammoniavirescens]|nr:hypothetical protein BDN67DRAFT_1015720 [Paxillus ammoniavirescens]
MSKLCPCPPPVSTLCLQGPKTVQASNHAIILNFGTLHLSIAFLTHTSIQLYPKDVWVKSVVSVHKELRKFYIGLAFEFEDFVLAFVTLDIMFQPVWGERVSELPFRHPDVFIDHGAFLEAIAGWVLNRSSSPRNRLALTAVRESVEWHGVSVYTAIELFVMAGVSPFLLEHEVFNNPSRTAWLCDAFYTFARRARTGNDLWELICPCIRDGVLAPTIEQRLRYKYWLLAYGKSHMRCTECLAALVEEYKVHYIPLMSSSVTVN